MTILRFTPYAYLIVAILLAIESYNQYTTGDNNKAIVMGLFTLAGIFMFFFRKHHVKKLIERSKKR